MSTHMTWSFHLPQPAGHPCDATGSGDRPGATRALLGPPSRSTLDDTADAIRHAVAAWHRAAATLDDDDAGARPHHTQWNDGQRRVERWRLERDGPGGLAVQATVWLGRDLRGLWLHATAEEPAPAAEAASVGPSDLATLMRACLATSSDWQRRGRLVARGPVPIEGAGAALRIVRHLADPQRACPVVAISTPPGQPAEAVQARAAALAEAFIGNATVVVLDAEAGRGLKRHLGRLACYDGAARVYLSPFSAQDAPARHPYRLGPSVWQGEAAADTARLAAWLHPLLGTHARATLPEPALLDAVIQAARAATGPAEAEWMALAEARDAAVLELQARDAVALELQARVRRLEATLDEQSFEFELLREERDRLAAELEVTKANMSALLDPYRSQATPPPPVLDSEPDDWDESLAAFDPDHPVEVMRAAGVRHRECLLFIDDWAREAARLHPEAVTPAKLATHLDLLAELAALRKLGGSLGTTDTDWLRLKGAPTTGESATDRTNAASRQARTWKVDGEPVTFELHTKPKEGTKQNRCARIYFRWCNERKRVLVWLGPHPDP